MTLRPCTSREKKAVLGYLEERFGIRLDTGKHELFMASKGRVFLGPAGETGLKEAGRGLQVARLQAMVKPSTTLLQLGGAGATRSRVALSREDALRFMRGEDLENIDGSDGYVIASYHNVALGCGLLKGRKLKNMVPRAKRLDVSFL